MRLIFTAFTEYLRFPAAAAKPDKPLTPSAIDATRSQTQVFYTFMIDHAPEAAAATGDLRWLQLTNATPGYRGRHFAPAAPTAIAN